MRVNIEGRGLTTFNFYSRVIDNKKLLLFGNLIS